MRRVLVVGAGASGMMAAITAADQGAVVTVYEKSDRIGKKILSTGNGKCNLSNEDMDLSNYYTKDKEKLKKMFSCFSVVRTKDFFEKCGLMIRSREGYLYPYCEQASAVLDVLRNTIDKKNIEVRTEVNDIRISVKKNGMYIVASSLGKKEFDSVVLACGSRAGIKGECEGYTYAKLFGHHIVPVLPALVQVRCKEEWFKAVAGVRAKAGISLYEDDTFLAGEYGELQLTDYGISGIPVFQLSRMISQGLYEGKTMRVMIDFVPEMESDEFNQFIERRIDQYEGMTCEAFLTGILHKKLSLLLLKRSGLSSSDTVTDKICSKLKGLCCSMKKIEVIPKAVNPFEQAQICCGGVDFSELNDTLESIYHKGLYICGEMIDIDGKCGGYNLQWAWTSGYIAGSAAAKGKVI